jgi:hypothetical protein
MKHLIVTCGFPQFLFCSSTCDEAVTHYSRAWKTQELNKNMKKYSNILTKITDHECYFSKQKKVLKCIVTQNSVPGGGGGGF